MRFAKSKIPLFLSLLAFFCISPVSAATKISISVKTVLASQDSQHEDPRLEDLVEELKSVFRYTSYRLLAEDRIELSMNTTGTISLPGKRVLKITPARIQANRAELHLVIVKGKKNIFQTTIQLLNRGSITLGGPKYKKGILLLNIYNSF